MKKLVLFYFIVFIAATFSAIFVSDKVVAKAIELYLDDYSKGTAMQRMSYSIIIETSIENIEAAKTGDVTTIINENCEFIDMSIGLITQNSYEAPYPFKIQLQETIEKGTQLIEQLKSEGYCGQ